jgi:D-inositol-3-phosphate glycosyltransferase
MSNFSLHIGFYCSSLSKGGLELNTIRYASYMKEAGYGVTLFLVDDSPMQQIALNKGLTVVVIKRNRRYLDLSKAWALRKLSQQHQINWWWFRDPRDMDIMAWTKFLTPKIKLLYHQAMQITHAKKDVLHTWRMSQIDTWVCLSEYLKHQVEIFTHYPKSRLRTIPLALPDAEQSTPYADGPFKALVVGRWDEQKNQHTVINALQLLHKDYPQIHLTFVGESTLGEGKTYEKENKKKVRHLDLQDNVHFMPFTFDLTQLFASSHLLIVPSLNETFGMVTIEGMRAGLPLLGANTGGTNELIVKNKCGETFEPTNAEMLAEKWALLLNNEEQRNQWARNARLSFEKNYWIAHQIDEWKKLLV